MTDLTPAVTAVDPTGSTAGLTPETADSLRAVTDAIMTVLTALDSLTPVRVGRHARLDVPAAAPVLEPAHGGHPQPGSGLDAESGGEQGERTDGEALMAAVSEAADRYTMLTTLSAALFTLNQLTEHAVELVDHDGARAQILLLDSAFYTASVGAFPGWDSVRLPVNDTRTADVLWEMLYLAGLTTESGHDVDVECARGTACGGDLHLTHTATMTGVSAFVDGWATPSRNDG